MGLRADRTMEVPRSPGVGRAGTAARGRRTGGDRACHSRPGLFFRLATRRGDRIEVGRRGGPLVRGRAGRAPAEEALPTERIWNRTSEPVLRLITCGGSFDRSSGHYRDNIIVFARGDYLTLSYDTVTIAHGGSTLDLDELAERVDAALAVDYHGQPSGRVRAVPDRRAIRWYTTIGLIDRPVAYRGRTALYGPRHLLQLVAVKRLQAKGLPLVAIQQELAGATDTQLARVAHLPAARRRSPGPWAVGDPATAARTATGGPRAGAAAARRPASGAAARRRDRRLHRRRAARRRPHRLHRSRAQRHRTPGDRHPARDPAGEGGRPCCWSRGGSWMRRTSEAILDAAGPLLAVLRDRGLGRTGLAPLGPAGGNEPRREHP